MYKHLLSISLLFLLPSVTKANIWVSFTNADVVTIDCNFYTDETKAVNLTAAGLSLNEGEWTAVWLPEIVYYELWGAGLPDDHVEGWLAGTQPNSLYQLDHANGISMMEINYAVTRITEDQNSVFWKGFTLVFASGLAALGARWVRKIMVGDSTPE